MTELAAINLSLRRSEIELYFLYFKLGSTGFLIRFYSSR
jgi:hypothetical protein